MREYTMNEYCDYCKHKMEDHHYMGYVCEILVNESEFPYCDCHHKRPKDWDKTNDIIIYSL